MIDGDKFSLFLRQRLANHSFHAKFKPYEKSCILPLPELNLLACG